MSWPSWPCQDTVPSARVQLRAADGDRPAGEPVAEDSLEGDSDPHRRLAGADDEHATVGIEPVADAVDDQLVAVQRNGIRGCAVDVAGREPRRRDSQPPAARLALAAVHERAVELEQARPGRRGGGWRVGGQRLAQAATAGAASSAPG